MIELDKLWIGDNLKIISSGLIVKYEGKAGQKAIVKAKNGDLQHVSIDNLVTYETSEQVENVFEKEELPINPAISPKHHQIPTTIDLHIEQLDPKLRLEAPHRILQRQIIELEKYLNLVESQGVSYITIIHGKGKGKLKNEVYHILKQRAKVKHFIEVSDGGAVEVIYY